MKVTINISRQMYKEIKESYSIHYSEEVVQKILRAIKNGIPDMSAELYFEGYREGYEDGIKQCNDNYDAMHKYAETDIIETNRIVKSMIDR